MPGLKRAAQRELDAAGFDFADQRKAELEMRLEPGHVKAVAVFAQLGQHVFKVHADETGQQEAVVQLGAPARELVVAGVFPETGNERAQQQLL
mgnify:CR=1 FL=1